MPLATSNTPVAAASDAGPNAGIWQAFKAGTTQVLASGATTAATMSASVGTSLVRLWATADAYVEIASSPTVTSAASMPISSGQAEYLVCNPDDKISVRGISASANVHVTPAATAL